MHYFHCLNCNQIAFFSPPKKATSNHTLLSGESERAFHSCLERSKIITALIMIIFLSFCYFLGKVHVHNLSFGQSQCRPSTVHTSKGFKHNQKHTWSHESLSLVVCYFFMDIKRLGQKENYSHESSHHYCTILVYFLTALQRFFLQIICPFLYDLCLLYEKQK